MNETTQFLISHGLACLFLVVFVEQMGLPIPAMPWLLTAGALSAAGKFNPFLGITITVVACILGDTFWFYLGRRHGRQVLSLLCRLSLKKDSCVRRTHNVFTQFGLRGLLVSKFVPGLNTVASPFAGMAGVGLNQFVAVDAIGSFAYAACTIGVGYFFSGQVAQIGAAIARFGGDALSALIVLIALYVMFKYWQRRHLLRKLRMARITVADLHQKMEAGENPFIVDPRPTAELNASPTIIRGAVHVELEKLPAYSDKLPRDQDIIVYCSCPNEFTAAHTALLLKKKGFTRIRPLLGGIDAWRRQNYPVDTWSTTATSTATATAPAPAFTPAPVTAVADPKVEILASEIANQPDAPA